MSLFLAYGPLKTLAHSLFIINILYSTILPSEAPFFATLRVFKKCSTWLLRKVRLLQLSCSSCNYFFQELKLKRKVILSINLKLSFQTSTKRAMLENWFCELPIMIKDHDGRQITNFETRLRQCLLDTAFFHCRAISSGSP